MKVAIIGERDFVLGFRGVGFSSFPVRDALEAGLVLEEVSRGDYSLVFITETFAKEIVGKIDEISQKAGIGIVIIPGVRERKFGVARLRKVALRAVGADIFGELQSE